MQHLAHVQQLWRADIGDVLQYRSERWNVFLRLSHMTVFEKWSPEGFAPYNGKAFLPVREVSPPFRTAHVYQPSVAREEIITLHTVFLVHLPV